MVDSSYIIKKGIIRSIVFYNEENGYAIARVDDNDSNYTIVGYIPGIKSGKNFEFEGNWVIHKRYGEQFQVRNYKEIEPETVDEIEIFLSSGVIKGVGPKTAKAIVLSFGEKTLDIIENSPERLMEVEGIGEKKWPGINQSYAEHKEFAEIVLHFAQYAISPSVAKRLYDVYGSAAIDLINEDPYRMIEDISGIGFFTADAIASKLGIKENNEQRIRSAVIYVLRKYINDGSTYLPENFLVEQVIKLIDVSTDETQDAIIGLVFDGKLTKIDIDGVSAVFLTLYYSSELSVCSELQRLHGANLRIISSDIEGLIKKTEENNNMILSDSQHKAVTKSLDSGVFVITGGPGTGKTTILHAIMDILTECGFEVAVAAPTGRAAKRITEATGYSALTIHRMLEYSFGPDDEQMFFGKNRENQLENDAIVIDEASMVDVLLMKALLEAIPSGARLIIVGDVDQLPPVGPGNVLRDILSSNITPSAYLSEIFRQEQESNIVVGAHNINKGVYPETGDTESDFYLIEKHGDNTILESILELCKTGIVADGKEYDFTNDIQVLTPMKKGILGNINLNKEFQKVLNPKKKGKAELIHAERIFREGDRVMQIKNNYQKDWIDSVSFFEGEGVFNGDMGRISKIDVEEGTVVVLFDGVRLVEYYLSDLTELDHAYSVTVHKSQGSEFPVVIMPIFATPPMLATRNILYTAITRGTDKVILVGEEYRLRSFVDNDLQKNRWSGLSFFLNKYEKI